MKKTITIITLFILHSTINAQSIIPLENKNGTREIGAYYKDTNNILDQYVGTWLYTNGTTSLTIVFQKEIMVQKYNYKHDILIGEIKYIENGVEKINSFSNLSLPVGKNHMISGNTIITHPSYTTFDDCLPGEKMLSLGYVENSTHMIGDLRVKKTTVNNQEAIKIHLRYEIVMVRENEPVPIPNLPRGEYILIKQ